MESDLAQLVAALKPRYGDKAEELARSKIAFGKALDESWDRWNQHPIKEEFAGVQNTLDTLAAGDSALKSALRGLAEEIKDPKARDAHALWTEYIQQQKAMRKTFAKMETLAKAALRDEAAVKRLVDQQTQKERAIESSLPIQTPKQ